MAALSGGWPWLVVAVPLAAAGGLAFARGAAAWWGAVAAAGLTLMLGVAVATTGSGAIGVRVDALAAHLMVLVAAAGLLAIWGARRGGRAALALGVLAGIELAALAEAPLVRWVGLAAAGLLLLSVPLPTATDRQRARRWQALLALVLGLAAALCGLLLLERAASAGLAAPVMRSLGFVLLLGGLAGGAGLAPLHGWMRAAGAGTPASAGLVPAFAAVALAVLLRARGDVAGQDGALDPGLGLLALGMASLGWAAVAAWRGGGAGAALPLHAGLAAVAFGLGGTVADAAGLTLLSAAVLMVPLVRSGGGWGRAGLLAALALLPPFATFGAALALLGEAVRTLPWLAVPSAALAAVGAAGLARAAMRAWEGRRQSRSLAAQVPALLVLGVALAAGLAPPAARWFVMVAEGLR
ncbi:MAG: hypothetical protein IT555_07240 [Acetobacteraceae bacterium]|nr:hypothetical protein [Acetobacteraceae bacterium]